ncbi:uroporphyrinogen-III C-methyltransferase [Myroides pelagicus]|uniref:uroporphyrinogen-III C-methyltransferase n=1 Tax=Myroides pelagicus TaxID=270914 RepID=A0A7K1GIS4_9FLAO|nr:uroporphyrinogen-III C-methyltransferase [Myroides pelagicus]MEC4115217.1 uroporphyrinogen-III C-methyltransferase [Myroides pelagicus]MTH28439.1 uroporphyrinogen-III C-methyltransferase [Myroides pelagicus]
MKKSKVILAGAGPGDPELISVKALRYLQSAEVILVDRLVSPELISNYTSAAAEVIYVGKQCSKGIFTKQEDINQLLVHYAKLGKKVLRLKGGDVSIFSNILDELTVLKQHGITYEIVPGISAGLAAAAGSGIPLTARGYSRGVRFLTLFDTDSISEELWNDWAKTEDTLVFYMSGLKLKHLVKSLLAHQISTDKGIAVIQQASTAYQQTTIYRFETIEEQELLAFQYVPTLFVIGRVVELHHDFAWRDEVSSLDTLSYFDNHLNVLRDAI